MKKYFYGIFVLLIIGLFVISGCAKSEPVAGQVTNSVTYEGVLRMFQNEAFMPEIEVQPTGYETNCAAICRINNGGSFCVYAEGKRNDDPSSITERYPITCEDTVFVMGMDNAIQEGAIDDFRCKCILPPS